MQRKRTVSVVYLLFLSTALVFGGCSSSDNPAQPVPEENTSTTAKTMSQTSVALFSNMSSFSQVDDFMSGPDEVADLEIPEFDDRGSAGQIANKTKEMALRTFRADIKKFDRAWTAQVDSVIFDSTVRDSVAGVTRRFKLTFNFQTSRARFFVVGFDYRSQHPLEYDSTEVVADLNGTIFDESDDVLVSLESLRRFKPGQLIREERGSFLPDPHAPGTEPEGGVLTSEINYSSASFILRTQATFTYHEGMGGSYEKTSGFSDGTTHRESATFAGDGSGSFEEDRRDGTRVRGDFNSPEDDGQGSYQLATTFPSGHDPSSVTESGSFTINSADSTLNGTFERVATQLDGSTVRDQVEVSQTRIGAVLSTTLNIESGDGGLGFLVITESPDVDQVRGEWNNADGTFVTFTAQAFGDGSSHFIAKQFASEVAFQNNEPAIATGEFDFYPDGSGRGVVTEGTDVYDVTIRSDGTIEITKRP